MIRRVWAWVRAATTLTGQRQTASSCPPCQTWRPHSYASRSLPLSVGSREDLDSEDEIDAEFQEEKLSDCDTLFSSI